VPHASHCLAWLENELYNPNRVQALPKAPSPFPATEHVVLPSHDIDFYRSSFLSLLIRLAKNLGIAALPYRSWSYFAENLKLLASSMLLRPVGDFLPKLVAAASQHDFCSTLFVVAQGRHRRDPSYRLRDVSARLAEARRSGFSMALHGSYRS